MKVCFINPPSDYLYDDEAYPPMALIHLASFVESLWHDAVIVDLAGKRKWEFPEADIYAITCVTPNYNIVSDICVRLRAITDKPIVIGGYHPTFESQQTYFYCKCNAVVVGEGESALEEMLTSGKVINKIYYSKPKDINDLPIPNYDLVDINRYREATVYTSRGCPYKCNFCSKMDKKNLFRLYPIENIVKQIEKLIQLNITHITFGDDNIGVNKKRLIELLTIIKNDFKITFRLNMDVRNADDEVFSLAKESGCTEISFGVESGSQKMLDAMNKQATVEMASKALLMCNRNNIKSRVYLIVNFPSETEHTIKETLHFMEIHKPDSYLISAFKPLPGSYVYDNYKEFGINYISKDWSSFFLAGIDFRTNFETEHLTRDVQRKYYNMLKSELEVMYG